MWSSKLRPIALVFGLGLLGAGLSGCSLTPAYSEQTPRIELSYAQPTSRAEQIVYQDLAQRLGSVTRSDVPQVSVKVSQSVRDLARSESPGTTSAKEVVLSGLVTVLQEDGVRFNTLFSGTRTASASFNTSGQVLADRAAETEATERAAHSLAETIRLTLLSSLPRP